MFNTVDSSCSKCSDRIGKPAQLLLDVAELVVGAGRELCTPVKDTNHLQSLA
jgi:hypothetical protein